MSGVQPFEGQNILITGAAKRIGRCIALELHRQGANVFIHYNSSEAEARSVAAEVGGAPVFAANLESVAEIRAMFAKVRKYAGRLDGFVNNAARFTQRAPLDMTEQDWDFIHSVNLKAAFFCCQEAARLMWEREGGRIVVISSLGGLRPWAEHVHYCASKAGVIHMTRALAKAFAPHISVNSVAPGVIPFEEKDEAGIQALVRETPAGRAGTGEEIAQAVAYFLSASKFITGQILAVDGGLSQR